MYYRERRELKVFQALLNTVPGLEERLAASDDEITIVAELVGPSRLHLLATPFIAPVKERCSGCERRRYQKPQRSYLGLDNPKRPIT